MALINGPLDDAVYGLLHNRLADGETTALLALGHLQRVVHFKWLITQCPQHHITQLRWWNPVEEGPKCSPKYIWTSSRVAIWWMQHKARVVNSVLFTTELLPHDYGLFSNSCTLDLRKEMDKLTLVYEWPLSDLGLWFVFECLPYGWRQKLQKLRQQT